jgi:hypothetical protein
MIPEFRFETVGEVREGDMFPILYNIYKQSISGVLVVESDGFEKRLTIEEGKILFAASDRQEDALGNFLLNRGHIDEEMFDRAGRHMSEHNTRFGRALIELGYFHYDQIWTWVPENLKSIVYSFFEIQSGRYRVLAEPRKDVENIALDLDILSVLVQGIRNFKSESFLKQTFEDIGHLFVCHTKLMTQLALKPYESHVFDLVTRESQLDRILKWSELMEIDTLRFLYLFLVMEIISTRRCTEKPDTIPEPDIEPVAVRSSSFSSFDEALRYYNMKYELIYKVMLKEIGPISLSLLSKAVEDIMENLPAYFQKARLNPSGGLEEDTLLKAVWYHDFDQHVGEFLRGLEEILYTEVYTVKKHLGEEYEQQVLKWINGIGN